MKNSSATQPLNVMIAAPCDIGWENMQGDDRVRFCSDCKLNVYNTSVMTTEEVRALAAKGPSCLRIFRRSDGTMITDDCPQGLRKIRDAAKYARKRAAFVASTIAASVNAMVAASIALFVNCAGATAQNAPSANDTECAKQTSNDQAACDKSANTAQKADTRAMTALKQARLFVAKNLTVEAEKAYAEAIPAVDSASSDPAFARMVFDEYIAFLIKNKKIAEAGQIASRKNVYFTIGKVESPRDMNGVGIEASTIDACRWTCGRSERHQKTAPTLPDGAPIPDNE